MPILLFNLASALDLSVENPHNNHTYTHSTGLPIDLTATDTNGTCWYEYDTCYENKFGDLICDDLHGQEIPNCDDMTYSVDYDGNYTMQIFATNGTDYANINASYRVDRTSEFEEGKPFLAGIIIIFLIALSFFSLKLADKLEETIPVIKIVVIMIGVFSMVVGGMISAFMAGEYLKFPLVSQFLATYSWLVFLLIFFVVIYVIVYMFKASVYPLMKKKI